MPKITLPGLKAYIVSALAFIKGLAGMWVVTQGMLDGGMTVMEILSSDTFWDDPNMAFILAGMGLGALRAGVAKAEKPFS